MNNLKYIQLSKPHGRAYQNKSEDDNVSYKIDQVSALSIQRTLDKIQLYNDYLYPLNDNFPLETWENRFGVTPPDGQAIEDRTDVIKLLLDYPRGQKNSLSLAYMQSKIIAAGFSNVTLYYNELGLINGYVQANSDTSSERYDVGNEKYNSFTMEGYVSSSDEYDRLILFVLSLKPLDCFVINRVNYQTVFAIDETTILALNSNQALLLNYNEDFREDGQYTALNFGLDQGLI